MNGGKPVDFVSEDDVRRAIQRAKIYIAAKTIITPAARDIGEPANIAKYEAAASVGWSLAFRFRPGNKDQSPSQDPGKFLYVSSESSWYCLVDKDA
jgi:hypothetical protein